MASTEGKILDVVPNYEPHEKQILLHNAPASYEDIWIILYGGSRGGGKSAGILADAFMFAQTYPGAKIGIFREKLDAVRQSFLDKLPTLFPQEQEGYRLYEYREKASSFYPSRSVLFPNGSYITFQRVASYQEALEMQGWEFHMLCFDEITKQEERTFKYLLSTVRSATTVNKYTGEKLRIPTKVLLGCNPGGIGHKWVKEMFITPTVVLKDDRGTPIQTKDTVSYTYIPGEDEPIKTFIRFIPASWRDNRHLNKSYIAMLQQQPEHKRKMDMDGNWDVVAGRMFDIKPEQKLRPGFVRRDMHTFWKHLKIFISIDWGYRPSKHAAHWWAVFPDKRVTCFMELYGDELVFEYFVEEIARMSEPYDVEVTCLPHDMFRSGDIYRDKTGKIIGETKSDVFEAYGLNPLPVTSGKGNVELRYDKIHSSMELKNADGVYKFRFSTECENLIEELENAVHWDIDPTKIDPKSLDHAIDSYGHFLVYYSDDIEPIGSDTIIVPDQRPYLQRLLEEDERLLELEEEEEELFVGIDNYYDL